MSPPLGAARAGVVGAGDAIPDSVVYQYDLINDWSQGDTTVSDGAGSAEMSLSGDFQDATIGGESGAEGDGTDDSGDANGPQALPSNETFGIAFTTQFSSIGSFNQWTGQRDGSGNNNVEILDAGDGDGKIEIRVGDTNGNSLRVNTTSAFSDGSAHAVVINKGGDSASNIDIYVDDMTSSQSTSTTIDDNFDHTNYSPSSNMGFWARLTDGSPDSHANVTCGVFEFNSDPYAESERTSFVDRRPEV